MKLRDFLNEEYLNEGITFFKDSKKIKMLIDKLNKKVNVVEDSKERAKLKAYIKKVNKVFIELKDLEKEYKSADKEEKKTLKQEYGSKVRKYNALIKESKYMEALLKKTGLFLIVGGLLAIIFIKYMNPNENVITTDISGDKTQIMNKINGIERSKTGLNSSDIKGDYFNNQKSQLELVQKDLKNTFGNMLDSSKELKQDIFGKIKGFFTSAPTYENPLAAAKGTTAKAMALANSNIKG